MAQPFSKRWFYNLLIRDAPADIIGNKLAVNHLKNAAKTARRAYLIGRSEKHEGKALAPFKDMPEGSSELEQNAWRFVYECYLVGHKGRE